MKASFCSPPGLRQELCSADACEALVAALTEQDWLTGSGTAGIDVCDGLAYLTVTNAPGVRRFMLVNADGPGEDEYVRVTSRTRTLPVVVYIGGNRTIFPVECFSGTDDLTRVAKALIEHGRIERDEHWVILRQQEWTAMDE
ncbi:hypothetical protein [Burkholderia ubonensis]|uniref:hypothetical protein n=1 Tax=Burkholderia ubonensis TaxID=101571 RepID=UPI000756716B|nr:hypothetical protein [Burkholderia ubonensis]KWN20304.1 hypothetical protein WM21_04145 [Burkholderia ubonensis]